MKLQNCQKLDPTNSFLNNRQNSIECSQYRQRPMTIRLQYTAGLKKLHTKQGK